MQIMVNKDRAHKVYNSAPTIKAIAFDIKGHQVTLESFDYGTAMGWGADVRVRVSIDGNVITPFHSLIFGVRRPDWLPADLTVKQWNTGLKPHLNILRAF